MSKVVSEPERCICSALAHLHRRFHFVGELIDCIVLYNANVQWLLQIAQIRQSSFDHQRSGDLDRVRASIGSERWWRRERGDIVHAFFAFPSRNDPRQRLMITG